MGSMQDLKPHAVCMPYPAQGHVKPMLMLAKLLHSRGFHITFVNNEFNSHRLLHARGPTALNGLSDFHFTAIPDGLPPSDADATQDVPSLCYSTMTTCLPHFKNLLVQLSKPTSGVPPVTCVVGDSTMTFTLQAAKELGLRCATLWTASACGFMGYYHYKHLMDKGLIPLKDEAQIGNGYLETTVDWIPGMCKDLMLRDFPSFIRTTDGDDIMLYFFVHETARMSLASAVIINTFDDLDRRILDAMAGFLPPIYTVGPLVVAVRNIPEGPLGSVGSNLWKEQTGLLEWLDGKEPLSIVYVNYGSITVMSNQQLVEFAWGLANSGYTFLWNVRPDLVKGNSAMLPPEFLKATKGRSVLTSWCPQEEILQHPAVGAFLTHSGWNSTLESICSGVPMLSWPFFAEQQTNCRYKRTEWGIGMEIGAEPRREEVERMIREVMEGEKGKEMRRRAMEWRKHALRAAQPGGPAMTNLDKLINEVLLPSNCT